jgi:hypothetical protein
MERWQSTWEHRVPLNLSESGVHPLKVGELLELADEGPELLSPLRLTYGPSNGSPELRELIAALYPGAGPENVLVTVGGVEANLAAAWHLTEPGGKVAVLLPTYMQVPGLVESFGGRVLPVPHREDEGWAPDLDSLARALARGARWIVVTHPNNPTGRILRPGEMERIVELAEAHGAWILADEVYRGAEASGQESPSFWARTEQVVVTHSLSKAYGLPGLRVGWVVAPPGVVQDLWARTDYTTITLPTLSDRLARLALDPAVRPRILDRTRRIIVENRELLSGWLDNRAELFSYRLPEAGAICHVRYDAEVGSTALAEELRDREGVLVVPGDHFGLDHTLRLGFGPPAHELEEALERIDRTFARTTGA